MITIQLQGKNFRVAAKQRSFEVSKEARNMIAYGIKHDEKDCDARPGAEVLPTLQSRTEHAMGERLQRDNRLLD